MQPAIQELHPLVDILWRVLVVSFDTLFLAGQFATSNILWIVWIVWWLFAVNWKKAWPMLAKGGWMPLVLLTLITALVASRVTLTSFYLRLADTAILVAFAFFCGWLQGILGCAPPEINLDPPAPAAHGHDDHHH